MSTVKIDKDVAMPSPNGMAPPNNKGREAHPWGALEVGDSFIYKGKGNRNTVSSLALIKRKQHGFKYATRTMGDGSVRVWRVA